MSRRDDRHKGVNLALQGGGAHGAFTWGVLDKLFEDDRIWIEAISGTSAGAMNAVVAAQGMKENGADGARLRLREFWKAVSRAAAASPIRRTPFAMLMGDWSLGTSPGYLAMDMATRLASPYDLPLAINPLRDLVGRMVDFDKVRACTDMGVFVAATNAETGLGRVFAREEVGLDAVMASACLPHLFRAVEVDGKPYWDGGYSGNPPLMPFVEAGVCDDVVIVQINPVRRPGTPRKAIEIQNRANEISFNSALLHELKTLHIVNGMIDAGEVAPGARRRLRFHIIEARKRMRRFDATSKMNAEWAFLTHLFEIGRETASTWLESSFEGVGAHSTVDLDQMLSGVGPAPHARAAVA